MTKDWTNVVTELCATCPLFWIVLFQFFICPGLTKIANHTIFIYGKMPVIHFSCTFIKNTKLHERSMVSYFSYMEIVWLAFSHKPKKKNFIFLNLIFQNVLNLFVTRSWFRGGGGRGRTPLFRDSTPFRPKGSPLCTILRNSYLVTDPKIFLKAPWAPICTNFEREARAKKSQFFWSKFSKKGLKTSTFGLFFFQNFDQNRVFLLIWKSSENQFGRPKKKVYKIFGFFFENLPHENPRSAPVCYRFFLLIPPKLLILWFVIFKV